MRLRVLQVSHRFPPHPGGTEYYVQKLSQFLASLGHEVTILTTSREQVGVSEESGCRVIRLRPLAEPLRNPLSLRLPLEFRRLVKEHDVVHMHSVYTFTTLLAFPFTPKERTIITLHGRAYYEGFLRYLAEVHERFSFRLVRGAARFIALTELDRELMLRRGIPPERITVIPNFVDVEELDQWASCSEPVEKESDVQLLFVGGLVEAKGLVQFLGDLRQVDEEVGLWIIGSGPLEPRLRSLARGMNVKFFGRMSRRDLIPYFLGADAVVLPSRSEGFPTVVLEAMTLRRPVILSDIEVHRGLFSDLAFLYTPERPETLLDALKRIKGSRDIVIKARKLVEEFYDVRVVGGQILDLYREIL